MINSPAGDVERFRRLDTALRVITSDLTLTVMLDRVVEHACIVADARFGALALLDSADGLTRLVHQGLDDATARYLGAVPDRAELNDVFRKWPLYSGRECSAGVHAPATDSTEVLVAPVIIGDEHYADLYVAGPNSGTFDDVDRELVPALARMVAPAIGHAQLFDRAQRSAEWLHASGEIARALLAGADIDMFGEIVARAITAAGADYGQIVIPTTSGGLEIIAASGLGAETLQGQITRNDISDFCRMITDGRANRLADVTAVLSDGFANPHDYGPAMIAPLLDARGTRGSLVVVRTRGRSQFTEHDLAQFATYASQVALAMQFADARADAERLQVVETRHNVARELHDVVIQRLFATGMGLNVLCEQLDDPQAHALGRYVRELDETIDEIRGRVFGVRGDARSDAAPQSRFPRIDLAGPGTAPATPRRGRRRSDWQDGTGAQRR